MLSMLLLFASCDQTNAAPQETLPDGTAGKSGTPAAATPEGSNMAGSSAAGRSAAPEALPVSIPSDRVTVRECGGSSVARRTGGSGSGYGSSGYGSGGGGLGTASPKSAPPPPPVKSVAAPAATPAMPDAVAAAPAGPAPAQPAAQSAPAGGFSGIQGGATGGAEVGNAPAAEPVAVTVAQGRAARGEAERAAPKDDANRSPAAYDGDAGAKQKEAKKENQSTSGALADKSTEDRARAGDEAASMVAEEAGEMADLRGDRDNRSLNNKPTDENSRWDWGGTTWLSNDDSMSLASAQRLLWALQQRGPVQASEIRPHEFLNYFSFDTRPVAAGETFSVLSGAEQTGPDTLTMSMAVKGAMPARMPLDLTLVIDRSGSMSAEGRMEYLKRGLSKMAKESLKRGDRIDMVLFDDSLCTPLENYVVGRDDPAILDNVISSLQPRGSTDLDLGLKEGYRIASGHVDTSGRNRRVMLISDALLNTGDVNVDTVSQVGRAYEESNIRLTSVGVGRDFNDTVLNKLSEKGKGAYVYLGSEAVVDRIFGVGFESMTRTIAHNVRFELDLPDSLALERFYGEEASTNPEEVQPIHYYAGTTQLFLQDLHLRSTGAVRSELVKLTIHFEDPQTGEQKTQKFQASVGDLMAADPRNLRKARVLMSWTDMLMARAMGASPCGAPFSTYKGRVDALGSDTEINWLDGLTRPLCGETAPPPRTVPAPAPGVAYKVKVDSDMPIAEVSLSCPNNQRLAESLSGSDTVAMFTAAPGASCTLTLQGAVPMQTTVKVPVTGGDLRCMVRGGQMSCS